MDKHNTNDMEKWHMEENHPLIYVKRVGRIRKNVIHFS
jgi:hypothetical protein